MKSITNPDRGHFSINRFILSQNSYVTGENPTNQPPTIIRLSLNKNKALRFAYWQSLGLYFTINYST